MPGPPTGPAMRLRLRQLEYFVAAGEAGSITLASARINVSQPSVSAAIAQLEAEFGFTLFVRHHAQGLSLTPEGLRFWREARALLAHAAELESVAGELTRAVKGPLEIGCLVTLYPLLVPALIHAFRARFPETRVRALAADQSALLERLRRGAISLALTYDLGIPAEIAFEPLAAVPPFAFVAAGHPLARRRAVALAELAAEPFLLLDLPHSRDYFLALFHEAGVAPRVGGAFEHLDVIRSLVARGQGFGLANLRPRNRASLDGRRLAYLGLEGDPPSLRLGIATVKGARPARVASAFHELARELVRDDHVPGAA